MRGAHPRLALALALGSVTALAACRSLPTAEAARVALETVGYEVVALQPRLGRGGSHLDVRVTAPALEDGETGKVAGVVWTTVPFRFDHLDVTVTGPGGMHHESFTYRDLTDRYGPRLEPLDGRDYKREVARLTNLLLAAVSLPGLALVGGLALLVRRATRRRSAPRPRPRRARLSGGGRT